jgi:S-adenosylmethionine synthetase
VSFRGRQLFTSESVTEGHPDKVADQISDAVLDAFLEQDPNSRVACEVLLTTGLCMVAGEITSSGHVNVPDVARETIRSIGYTDPSWGLDGGSCAVLLALDRQSSDIGMGVDRGGAGDQGMMFGYACRETEELMPLPITLAHRLSRRLAHCRRTGSVDFFRPDGKSQVTVEYRDGNPTRVDTVVISTQHGERASQGDVREAVREHVIEPVIPAELMDRATKIHVNPTGRFVIGGPHGDTGLTGRKIIVDTYGGMGHHGGGAFSGKDPTKVDRSASYMARHIAKNLVAANLAERIEVQLAYVIGEAEPVSVLVNTFGTGQASEDRLVDLIRESFDLTPAGIIKYLDLRRPIYRATAAYGHFGRSEASFTWESTQVAERLQSAVRA